MTKRVLLLVEGQTEERFVKDVLARPFERRQVYLFPTLLVTKRVKHGPNFKGGVTSFGKFETDLRLRMRDAGGALVTTMLDYQGLPTDFPGMSTRPPNGTPEQRVRHVEAAIHAHFGFASNLLPFLSLHEFEAWLFASTDELPRAMTEPQKEPQFAAIKAEFSTPEEINERPGLAPSKRIALLFPAYKKTLHGPSTAARIGLDRIRAECAHFAWWLGELESYAAA